MNSPTVVKISRRRNRQSEPQRSLRELNRQYRNERLWSFVIELALFGVLAAISAWPVINAVEALRAL